MSYLGDFAVDATVNFLFTSHDKDGGAVAPSTAFEAADLIIYKNNSATQRSSTAGVTMTSPFDAIVGLHQVSIDLSDNTDAGFYAAGSDYFVILSPDETVDSETVVRVVAHFSIARALATTHQPPSAEAIADAVLDEAKGEHAGHLASIPTDPYTGTPPTAEAIADAVLDEAKGEHTGHLANIPTDPYTGTPPTAEAIADAVLDEALGEHTGHLATIPTNPYTGTPPAVDAIAYAVFEEPKGSHIGYLASIPSDAPPTADAIADAVLDEALGEHTGHLASIPTDPYTGTPPTADAIADAVLDEAKGEHAGHLASIPTDPYMGTPPTAEAIADAVLDEAKGEHAGHLASIPTDPYTGTPPTAAAIADAVLDEAKGEHAGHLASIPTDPYTGTPPSAAAIADAVLDEAKGEHAGHLASIPTDPYTGTPPTAEAIADAVLDEAKGEHAGHLASIPTDPYTGTPPTAAAIADAVLDEAKGEHAGHLATIPTATPPTAAAIADAVLDEALGEHAGHLASIPTDPYTGTPPTVGQIRSELEEGDGAVLAKLAATVEADGELWRFTENALEEAPSASGATDWSASEKQQIRQALGVAGSAADTSGDGNLDVALTRINSLLGSVEVSASAITGTEEDIDVYRGDTKAVTFDLNRDIEGAALAFTVKRKLTDTQADALITKTSAAGEITITSPSEGQFSVFLEAEDTEDLCSTGKTAVLHYDVEMTLDGAVETVAFGEFRVHCDVTAD